MRGDERVRIKRVEVAEDTSLYGSCDEAWEKEADDTTNLLVMANQSLPEEERISCPLNLEVLELLV